jgi:hypothetical protein
VALYAYNAGHASKADTMLFKALDTNAVIKPKNMDSTVWIYIRDSLGIGNADSALFAHNAGHLTMGAITSDSAFAKAVKDSYLVSGAEKLALENAFGGAATGGNVLLTARAYYDSLENQHVILSSKGSRLKFGYCSSSDKESELIPGVVYLDTTGVSDGKPVEIKYRGLTGVESVTHWLDSVSTRALIPYVAWLHPVTGSALSFLFCDGAPTGSTTNGNFKIDTTNFALYQYINHAWHIIGGSGGGGVSSDTIGTLYVYNITPHPSYSDRIVPSGTWAPSANGRWIIGGPGVRVDLYGRYGVQSRLTIDSTDTYGGVLVPAAIHRYHLGIRSLPFGGIFADTFSCGGASLTPYLYRDGLQMGASTISTTGDFYQTGTGKIFTGSNGIYVPGLINPTDRFSFKIGNTDTSRYTVVTRNEANGLDSMLIGCGGHGGAVSGTNPPITKGYADSLAITASGAPYNVHPNATGVISCDSLATATRPFVAPTSWTYAGLTPKSDGDYIGTLVHPWGNVYDNGTITVKSATGGLNVKNASSVSKFWALSTGSLGSSIDYAFTSGAGISAAANVTSNQFKVIDNTRLWNADGIYLPSRESFFTSGGDTTVYSMIPRTQAMGFDSACNLGPLNPPVTRYEFAHAMIAIPKIKTPTEIGNVSRCPDTLRLWLDEYCPTLSPRFTHETVMFAWETNAGVVADTIDDPIIRHPVNGYVMRIDSTTGGVATAGYLDPDPPIIHGRYVVGQGYSDESGTRTGRFATLQAALDSIPNILVRPTANTAHDSTVHLPPTTIAGRDSLCFGNRVVSTHAAIPPMWRGGGEWMSVVDTNAALHAQQLWTSIYWVDDSTFWVADTQVVRTSLAGKWIRIAKPWEIDIEPSRDGGIYYGVTDTIRGFAPLSIQGSGAFTTLSNFNIGTGFKGTGNHGYVLYMDSTHTTPASGLNNGLPLRISNLTLSAAQSSSEAGVAKLCGRVNLKDVHIKCKGAERWAAIYYQGWRTPSTTGANSLIAENVDMAVDSDMYCYEILTSDTVCGVRFQSLKSAYSFGGSDGAVLYANSNMRKAPQFFRDDFYSMTANSKHFVATVAQSNDSVSVIQCVALGRDFTTDATYFKGSTKTIGSNTFSSAFVDPPFKLTESQATIQSGYSPK